MKFSRRIALSGLIVLGAAGILLASSGRILWWLGSILVAGEAPQKADIVVVLGGDFEGNRILTAAALVRQGYAPKALVSGAGTIYGHHESDLAIDFAVHNGYPSDEFIASHYPALSTLDEARADIRELRKLGVHKYLLVTSAWHTARAGRIFRREGSGLEEHLVSAQDYYWANGRWWTNREGRKIWFFETVKTIANYLGI